MFSDIPIHYFSCTHRAIKPSQTILKYETKLKIAGITRITDITNLDRIGIPVYSAIRPTAQEGSVSVYAGKGAKKDQAKASAMMEGFERYSAEKQAIDKEKIIIGTFNEIENAINPLTLILPKNQPNYLNNFSGTNKALKSEKIANEEYNKINRYDMVYDSYKIEWIESTDIITEEKFHIPSNAVFHPYVNKTENNIINKSKSDSNSNETTVSLFKSNTNGLASGNVLEEAVLHGILEVIERDAWSIFELTKKNKKQISTHNIENTLINNLLKKFNEQSIKIKLMDLTADVDIPTIAATADDTLLKDPALLTLGVGTHLNPEIAILRALTEVAQSRATQIHGTREDTTRANFMRKAGYERMLRINKHYFNDEEDKINVENIENKSTNSLKEDIKITISELKRFSIDKVLFTDLTRKELGINVVRIVIPEMEVYSVDPERIGNRHMTFNKSN